MSDCYTHNPYVPYMPDINHVDSCPHTAVDNTLVIRMVCARSDGVLSGSWVHVPRPPRFHTRVFQPFRSRLLSRSVPIFRTNLWRYARRITMAMAIAASPPIWCIPTLSDNAQCFVAIFSDSSGDLCRLVTPYKSLLLLCKVVYRAEIVKASRTASR